MIFERLVILIFPATVLLIVLVKSSPTWIVQLKAMPRPTQTLFVLFMACLVIYGGSKPGPVGPTKANLKLLLAERASKKLSSGQPYGEKHVIVNAASATESASNQTAIASSQNQTSSNTLSVAVSDIPGIINATRHYLRLVPGDTVYTGQTLYGETLRIDVTNGIASAHCWFNVVPNSEPLMRFHFAAETATNRYYSAIPTHSSFPDTTEINGKPCYTYYFDVPPMLLNTDGSLMAPLDYSRQIAFGSPETHEPFDLRGGLALVKDGKYYLAITGWVTNSINGDVYYYDNGRLANPPKTTQNQGAENENM